MPLPDAELSDLADLSDDQLSDRIRERFTERRLTEAAVSALADLVRLEVQLRRAEMSARRTEVDDPRTGTNAEQTEHNDQRAETNAERVEVAVAPDESPPNSAVPSGMTPAVETSSAAPVQG